MKIYNPATDKFQGRKVEITVWLLPTDTSELKEPSMFWCPNCRGPVAQYEGGLIESIVPGRPPKMKTPIVKVMCRNNQCRRVYNFAGIVSE